MSNFEGSAIVDHAVKCSSKYTGSALSSIDILDTGRHSCTEDESPTQSKLSYSGTEKCLTNLFEAGESSNCKIYNDNQINQYPNDQIWEDVEQFLSKPPPNLGTISRTNKEACMNNKSIQLGVKLPIISKPSNDSFHRSIPTKRPTKKNSTHQSAKYEIDPELLQAAFDYAQQLQKCTSAGTDTESQSSESTRVEKKVSNNQSLSSVQRLRNKVANCTQIPSEKSNEYSRNSIECKVTKGESPANVIRAHRPQNVSEKSIKMSKMLSVYSSSVKCRTRQKKVNDRRENLDWNDSTNQGEASSHGKGSTWTSSMDPQTQQALITNFQNGTSVNELRKELEASRQNMEYSRDILHNAAKSFYSLETKGTS